MKSRIAARITSPDPSQKGKAGFILYNTLPPRKEMMAPIPPMKLMMPFAWERLEEGVMSGMSATTGVRQKAMLKISVVVQATKSGRTATSGISPNMAAPLGAPIRMNGMRRKHTPDGRPSLAVSSRPAASWRPSGADLLRA